MDHTQALLAPAGGQNHKEGTFSEMDQSLSNLSWPPKPFSGERGSVQREGPGLHGASSLGLWSPSLTRQHNMVHGAEQTLLTPCEAWTFSPAGTWFPIDKVELTVAESASQGCWVGKMNQECLT